MSAPKSIADILDDAATLIEPEGAWMQGDIARAPDGSRRDATQIDDAVCFCAAGAIWRAVGEPFMKAQELVVGRVFPAMHSVIGTGGIGSWNDTPGRTQAEVVAKLREAAAKARE